MRVCKNCGAKLQAATPGSIVRCPFCGVEELIPLAVTPFGGGGSPYAHPPVVVRPSTGAMVLPFVMVGVIMAIGIGVGLFSTMRAQQRAAELSTPPAIDTPNIDQLMKEAQQPKPPQVNLSNIATAPFQGWETIDAPGMIGPLDAFDAVANYTWAQKIVLAWKPDGVIMRIDVDRVGRDGLVNLKSTPDASVMYRAFSPKCRQDYTDSTAVVDPKLACELYIQIKSESGVVAPTALKTGDQLFALKYDTAMKSPVCTLQQVFQKLDKAGKLPQKPVFNASVYDVSGRARWSIDQIISGADTVGYVNATTCAIE